MQDLSKLFINLFDDQRITNNRLVTFAEDQITRLTDNNPASVYDGIIAETTTATTELKNLIVEHGSQTSTREGSTVSKNTAQQQLTQYIGQQEGLVKSVFGKNSAEYQEFFPQGLTAFRTGTEEEYDNKTKIVVEKAVKYVTQLGVPFKTSVTQLYDAWHTAYMTQGDSTVTADNTATEEQTAAAALQLQLSKNALFIASNNVDKPSAYDTYFDTSLLFAQHRTHIYKGTAPVNSTSIVHNIEYSAGKHFVMKNKGAVELTFGMFLGNTPVGNSFTMQPGAVLEKSFAEFFSTGDSLRVTNNSATIEGIYEVREVA